MTSKTSAAVVCGGVAPETVSDSLGRRLPTGVGGRLGWQADLMTISQEVGLELAKLAGLVLTEPDVDTALVAVTRVAVAVVDACDGASLTMRRAGTPSVPAANDGWAVELDRLQFTEQEGPCLDCLREGSIMRVRDLLDDTRFPSYGPKAVELGARSTLSLPLAADGRTVGALNLYSRRVDAFDTELLAIGELLAAHASLAVAAATAYFSSRDLAEQMRQALESRAVIEQAKGALMATTGGSAEAAFASLVERSQRANVKLREVAQAVVDEVRRPQE